MSQQFLSKYFSPSGNSANNGATAGPGSSKRPSSKRGEQALRSRRLVKTTSKTSEETESIIDEGGPRQSTAASARDSSAGVGWQCPKCTFHNAGASSGSSCSMCGHRRPVPAATAAPSDKAREEIEVSSSGDETRASADSDAEDAPIGHARKRKQNDPGTNSSVGDPARLGKRSRATESQEGAQRGSAPSSSPKDDVLRGMVEEPVGGRGTDGQGSDKSTSPNSPRARSPRSSGTVGRGGRVGAAAHAAENIVISADSFDLREDLSRRKLFQASVEEASSDGGVAASSGTAGIDRDRPHSSVGGSSAGDHAGQADEAKTGADRSGGKASGTSSSRGKARGKGKGGASGGVKLTPMEQQVSDLKAQHPGVLLLVECGYRYRFFGEDALVAAKVLRIYAYMDHNFHVASIPTYRLAVHLRRLVEAGYKVGVVRQAESAALKAAGLSESGKKSGTFKRELAAVFTQATWMEGAVEALLPSSASNAGGGGAGGVGSSSGNGPSGGGQGSWRKIGGTWKRVGGWVRKAGSSPGKQGDGDVAADAEPRSGQERTDATVVGEADMDNPVSQVDVERAEQWLLSIYEEDASTPAAQGEPLSIRLALRDAEAAGSRSSLGGGEVDVGSVRIGLVAVDVRTGKVVFDTFVESAGQRQNLDTRLRHLRPLELLAAGPRLSKATEAALARYSRSAVDARGDKRAVRMERLPPEEFCFDAAQAALTAYYGSRSSDGLPPPSSDPKVAGSTGASALTRVLDLRRAAICALGPLMTHLQRFGLDRALASPDLVSFSQSHYMTLDAVTLRDLEVFQCHGDGREAGSLFSLLDRTHTAFGRRVLAGWVRQPLLSPESILARQDAVEELATDSPPLFDRLRPLLRDLKDLDPAIASLHHRRIQPSRLLSLLSTMRKVFAVMHPPSNGGAAEDDGDRASWGEGSAVGYERAHGGRSALLVEAVKGVPANMAPEIVRFLAELDPEASASDNYVSALVDGEKLCEALAKAAGDEQAASVGLEKELHEIRKKVRKPSLQWKTLRTGPTSTVEYLVEFRKSEAKKLADSTWMQVSQTKDLVRFHTPGVLRLQQQLLQARESRDIAARQAWAVLVAQVDDQCFEGFRSAVQALGTLDALLSLAAVAKLPGYVKPVYRNARLGDGGGDARGQDDEKEAARGDAIVLRGARHPTVERVLEGGFVPNDVDIRRGECLVVTGPNMGGKSSTVRMVALLCIMGQIGSYVPADSADLYCLDGVYTRMGAGDDLAADMSTFMVELWHTSYILKHASSRSLVVLDELGRGTSTHDGVAIALATLRHLVEDLGAATLFVTHYLQVADLASDRSFGDVVKNAHMSFLENTMSSNSGGVESYDIDGQGSTGGRKASAPGVTFLYRLVVGRAHESYGLNVARAAGMDADMIRLAAQKSAAMHDRSIRPT